MKYLIVIIIIVTGSSISGQYSVSTIPTLNGETNGSIGLELIDELKPYDIQLFNEAGVELTTFAQTGTNDLSFTFTPLAAGTYNLKITDRTECITTISVVIDDEACTLEAYIEDRINATSFSDFACGDGVATADGYIKVSWSSNKTGAYVASLSNHLYNQSQTRVNSIGFIFSNIPGGSYTLTIRSEVDDRCMIEMPIEIGYCSLTQLEFTEPFNFNCVTTALYEDATINIFLKERVSNDPNTVEDDGRLDVEVQSTIPAFAAFWTKDGSFYSSEIDISGLGNGEYCLHVHNGCGEEISECFVIEDCTSPNVTFEYNIPFEGEGRYSETRCEPYLHIDITLIHDVLAENEDIDLKEIFYIPPGETDPIVYNDDPDYLRIEKGRNIDGTQTTFSIERIRKNGVFTFVFEDVCGNTFALDNVNTVRCENGLQLLTGIGQSGNNREIVRIGDLTFVQTCRCLDNCGGGFWGFGGNKPMIELTNTHGVRGDCEYEILWFKDNNLVETTIVNSNGVQGVEELEFLEVDDDNGTGSVTGKVRVEASYGCVWEYEFEFHIARPISGFANWHTPDPYYYGSYSCYSCVVDSPLPWYQKCDLSDNDHFTDIVEEFYFDSDSEDNPCVSGTFYYYTYNSSGRDVNTRQIFGGHVVQGDPDRYLNSPCSRAAICWFPSGTVDAIPGDIRVGTCFDKLDATACKLVLRQNDNGDIDVGSGCKFSLSREGETIERESINVEVEDLDGFYSITITILNLTAIDWPFECPISYDFCIREDCSQLAECPGSGVVTIGCDDGSLGLNCLACNGKLLVSYCLDNSEILDVSFDLSQAGGVGACPPVIQQNDFIVNNCDN